MLLDPIAPDGKSLKRAGDALVIHTHRLSDRQKGEHTGTDVRTRSIDTPGEYDLGGVYARVMTATRSPQSSIVTLVMDGIVLVHCGGLSLVPPDALIEGFERVDILTVSVGGGDGLSPKDAGALARALEPRVVIPLRYKTPHHGGEYGALAAFLKEMGSSSTDPEKRLKLSKEDIREGDVRVMVLDDAP